MAISAEEGLEPRRVVRDAKCVFRESRRDWVSELEVLRRSDVRVHCLSSVSSAGVYLMEEKVAMVLKNLVFALVMARVMRRGEYSLMVW